MKRIIKSSHHDLVFRLGRVLRLSVGVCFCAFLVGCMDGEGFPDLSVLSSSSSHESRDDYEEYDEHGQPVEIPTEILLDAQGNWNLVEKGRDYDPAQAHLEARKRVNTKSWKKNKTLEAHFEPDAKSGEDGKFRVLKLERQGQPDISDTEAYEIAETSVVKPTRTVAGKDLAQRISGLFGGDNGVPVPAVKPRKAEESGTVKVVSPFKRDAQLSHPRMVGDIVVPPLTPARKILVAQASVGNTSLMERVVSDVYSDYTVEKGGESVVIPRRKPMKNGGGQIKQHLSSYDVASSGGLPVPSLKPKTGRGVFKKGAVSAKTVRVTKLRAGSHPDKTRVVIEVSRATSYKVAVDHIRKVLRLKIANARSVMEMKGVLSQNKLIGSYVFRPMSDGSLLLEMRLKSPARIHDTMLLRPNMSSQHRIVVDIKGS